MAGRSFQEHEFPLLDGVTGCEPREVDTGGRWSAACVHSVPFDPMATHQAREDAASRVALEVVPRVRGEVLVKKDERVTADHLATLENARRTSTASSDIRQVLALIFVASMLW